MAHNGLNLKIKVEVSRIMNLTYEVTENGYKILNNGVVWIVQDGYIPYPKPTMEESAQAHIDEIIQSRKENVPTTDLQAIQDTLQQMQTQTAQTLEELKDTDQSISVEISKIVNGTAKTLFRLIDATQTK